MSLTVVLLALLQLVRVLQIQGQGVYVAECVRNRFSKIQN